MKKDKRPYQSIRKPNFLGGQKAFLQFLDKNLVYPPEAIAHKKDGMSLIKCEINDRGKVLTAHTINKLGYGLDEEAERLCLLMRFDNTEERGLKITHSKTIRIKFTLPAPPPVEAPLNFNYETTTGNSKPNSYQYTISLD